MYIYIVFIYICIYIYCAYIIYDYIPKFLYVGHILYVYMGYAHICKHILMLCASIRVLNLICEERGRERDLTTIIQRGLPENWVYSVFRHTHIIPYPLFITQNSLPVHYQHLKQSMFCYGSTVYTMVPPSVHIKKKQTACKLRNSSDGILTS